MFSIHSIISLVQFPDAKIEYINPDTVRITLPASKPACPYCHCHCVRVHGYRDQVIKDFLALSARKFLIYHKRRYRCCHCSKTFFESNPIVGKYQRISKDTIAHMIFDHGGLSTSSDIAKRYGVSTTTIQRLFKNVSADGALELPEVISIDEFKGNVGEEFQVVINDPLHKKCLNVLESTTPDFLHQKILEYPLEERLKVRHVCIDMNKAFRRMIRECFPKAQIAADKFHVVRLANNALESVRKTVQKKLHPEKRKWMKGSRKLLLKREKNLKTDEEKQQLQAMLNQSEELSAAYAMKEEYFKILESKDNKDFVQRLKRFQKAVEASKIESFKKVLKTTLQWKKEIIHTIATGYNNGFTEGCNNTIKTLKDVYKRQYKG